MNNLECVYFFPNNKKQEEKKYISKLMKKNYYINNEIKTINKLTKYKKYFILPEKINSIKQAEIDDETYSFQEIVRIKDDNYFLFKYENRKLIYLKYYLKTLKNSKKYIYSVINFYKYLLFSLNLLVQNNIIHNNIDFDNIVINELEDPLLVDFSNSLNELEDKKNISEKIKKYVLINDEIKVPELKFVSYMLKNELNSLSFNNIEKIINDIIDNNNLIKNFGDTFINELKIEGTKYFTKYINKSYEYIIEDILKYSHTWDNYNLSMVYLKILIDIHKHINNQNKFIIYFMKMLVMNISIAPLKRLSIEETTNKFEEILSYFDINLLIDFQTV